MNRLLAATAVCLLATMSAQASLQDQVDSMYNDMTNYTAPGVFETQRRGVLSGGSFVARGHIMQENLIGFVPPGYNAGCGGLDLFGGSFSYVNSDQLVQLLRAIAANALTYSFQLALNAMCRDCMQQIETLQKKIQQFNQYFGNSCQLAKGLVTDAKSSFEQGQLNSEAMQAQFSGFGDLFSSWSTADGGNVHDKVDSVAATAVQQQITGNIVWRELRRQAVGAWFAAGGDDDLLQAVMSLTGTVIISPTTDGATGTGRTRPENIFKGNKIRLTDLIDGGTVTYYQCVDGTGQDQCLEINSTASMTLTGLQPRLIALLLGDAGSPGVVTKFATNTGTITDEERAVLAALPQGMGAMIRTLAIKNAGMAAAYVNSSMRIVSREMAYTVAFDLIRTAETAVARSDHTHAKKALDELAFSREALNNEHAKLVREYGSAANLLTYYNELIKALDKREYVVGRVTPASQMQ